MQHFQAGVQLDYTSLVEHYSRDPIFMTEPNRQEHEATLARLDRFSYYTDSNIRIPFTGFRLGLSPLIGLVPVIGDFAGLLLSLYVLKQARGVNAPKRVQARMIRNMMIEFVGGLIPVIGDAFDAIFKANTRNTELLRAYIHEQLEDVQQNTFPWKTLIWLSLLFAALGALLLALFV
ncbi:MAG: DUF4112 domain-containing protein [Xanthomonadaceae bacterium]|nr:DUF4112 domain-containing protein [Xanthomonadaceae bacterium]